MSLGAPDAPRPCSTPAAKRSPLLTAWPSPSRNQPSPPAPLRCSGRAGEKFGAFREHQPAMSAVGSACGLSPDRRAERPPALLNRSTDAEGEAVEMPPLPSAALTVRPACAHRSSCRPLLRC